MAAAYSSNNNNNNAVVAITGFDKATKLVLELCNYHRGIWQVGKPFNEYSDTSKLVKLVMARRIWATKRASDAIC